MKLSSIIKAAAISWFLFFHALCQLFPCEFFAGDRIFPKNSENLGWCDLLSWKFLLSQNCSLSGKIYQLLILKLSKEKRNNILRKSLILSMLNGRKDLLNSLDSDLLNIFVDHLFCDIKGFAHFC